MRALAGGTHARTCLIRTVNPEREFVLREFPPGDAAAANETRVLAALDGLDGLAPRLLASDVSNVPSAGSWVLISCLPGIADLSAWPASRRGRAARPGTGADPCDGPGPSRWIRERVRPSGRLARGRQRTGGQRGYRPPRTSRPRTGRADALRLLVRQHAVEGRRAHRGGGLVRRRPRSARVRCGLVPARPVPALRRAHRRRCSWIPTKRRAILALPDRLVWDLWAVARSCEQVESWVPNYRDLGRADLTATELRKRHTAWTHYLIAP